MEKFLERVEYAVNFIDHLEKESPSSEIGVSSRKIKVLQEAKKLFEVMNYAKDINGKGVAIYDYQEYAISKNYTKEKMEKLENLLNKIDSAIDREVNSYTHLHNSIIQKMSHAAADIVTNTKKYHLAEADASMKVGDLERARKHAESAKESIEELKFFMQVYAKIMNKYTRTMKEDDASCKDCVLKMVTKSKLTDIKADLDAALEEFYKIETEKSNVQEIRDLLTKTLQEERGLISRVSDYSFDKILPTLDAYSVILGAEKNLLDSASLAKLPFLSKHFSINLEELEADINKTFHDAKKVDGINAKVQVLKDSCIAMNNALAGDRQNNALTGNGQNADEYLGESLESRAGRCISGADKFLSAGFEPLLKGMYDKNFYRDKAPDFLSFYKLMCSIRNDNLYNEPHISAPQTVSLPNVVPISAPMLPDIPRVHDEL